MGWVGGLRWKQMINKRQRMLKLTWPMAKLSFHIITNIITTIITITIKKLKFTWPNRRSTLSWQASQRADPSWAEAKFIMIVIVMIIMYIIMIIIKSSSLSGIMETWESQFPSLHGPPPIYRAKGPCNQARVALKAMQYNAMYYMHQAGASLHCC